jgi:hypothetical protein
LTHNGWTERDWDKEFSARAEKQCLRGGAFLAFCAGNRIEVDLVE